MHDSQNILNNDPEKSRAGHTAGVRELLQKYGACKLSQVDPANYEALLRDAEVIDNAT